MSIIFRFVPLSTNRGKLNELVRDNEYGSLSLLGGFLQQQQGKNFQEYGAVIENEWSSVSAF